MACELSINFLFIYYRRRWMVRNGQKWETDGDRDHSNGLKWGPNFLTATGMWL
jgi:hypothetical protein